MSGAFHHIAVASLPVAIGLLVLALVARGVLSARVDDGRIARLAAEHLGALSTWCLIFTAVYAVALGGAGDLGAGGLGVALVIGGAAVLLRAEGGAVAEEESGEVPGWAVAASDRAASSGDGVAAREERAAAPAGAPRSLWAEPADEPASRSGLWSS